MDDETGLQPRLVGFDLKEPTARQHGKPEAIAQLRQSFPYETIIMVGDGITGALRTLPLMSFCIRPKWPQESHVEVDWAHCICPIPLEIVYCVRV